ncbi:hypothetical protein WA1_28430 [Scytonema hofmannii PCC 7110]|uniref:Uncharacterized protein n=1 Tax=Scytonema hofmannii PCC 7110 TaxID=128403 RepID=A0A139X5B3_9CYAN|nr:hypothetical protein WA1_28430 [Scytonema hofmannii PCC 7110]
MSQIFTLENPVRDNNMDFQYEGSLSFGTEKCMHTSKLRLNHRYVSFCFYKENIADNFIKVNSCSYDSASIAVSKQQSQKQALYANSSL